MHRAGSQASRRDDRAGRLSAVHGVCGEDHHRRATRHRQHSVARLHRPLPSWRHAMRSTEPNCSAPSPFRPAQRRTPEPAPRSGRPWAHVRAVPVLARTRPMHPVTREEVRAGRLLRHPSRPSRVPPIHQRPSRPGDLSVITQDPGGSPRWARASRRLCRCPSAGRPEHHHLVSGCVSASITATARSSTLQRTGLAKTSTLST